MGVGNCVDGEWRVRRRIGRILFRGMLEEQVDGQLRIPLVVAFVAVFDEGSSTE